MSTGLIETTQPTNEKIVELLNAVSLRDICEPLASNGVNRFRGSLITECFDWA